MSAGDTSDLIGDPPRRVDYGSIDAQRGLLRLSEAYPQTRGADQDGYYHFRGAGRP